MAEETKTETIQENIVNLNKLKSFTDLIVYGYIRPMEQEISFIALNIIPLSITQMCLKYFAPQTAMQLFARIATKKKKKRKVITTYTTTIEYDEKLLYIDTANKQVINMKIKHENRDISCINRAIFANEFSLSSTAIQYFTDKVGNNYYDDFELITKRKYSALISSNNIYFFPNINVFTKTKDLKNVSDIDLYWFPLPTDCKIDECSIFSNYYGLISLVNNSCSTLKFDDEERFKWIHIPEFQGDAQRLCLMNAYAPIDDKIFLYNVGSGYYGPATNYVFSLKNNASTKVAELTESYRRQKFGTYYDMTHETVYLLGGDHGLGNLINRFDFVKNKWYSTNTIFEHNEYPVAWMDGFVLYIAGDMEGKMGTVECLDTRMDESHWILANKDLQIDKILPPSKFKRLFSNTAF